MRDFAYPAFIPTGASATHDAAYAAAAVNSGFPVTRIPEGVGGTCEPRRKDVVRNGSREWHRDRPPTLDDRAAFDNMGRKAYAWITSPYRD